METLELKDGRTVYKKDYLEVKTNDLIEFGYTKLTKETVSDELEKLLKGEKVTVIGMFMKDDLLLPENNRNI